MRARWVCGAALTAVAGLMGCASKPAEADFDLTIQRGGVPWQGAVVMLQPIDRRIVPVNPVEIGPAIDYVSRPKPEAVIAGRTDSNGMLRIRVIESFRAELCILGPGGATVVVLLEPVTDEASDDARGLAASVLQDPGQPRVEVKVKPVG